MVLKEYIISLLVFFVLRGLKDIRLYLDEMCLSFFLCVLYGRGRILW